MYSLIFQAHKISITVFLLIYLIKTILLLFDKDDVLASFVKYTRVPEMVVSFLFLATGVYMAFGYPMMGMVFYIKLAAVFVSVPLAVVGFKKKNKYMATGSFFLLIVAYGMAEINKNALNRNFELPVTMETEVGLDTGKLIYNEKCALCHGENGDAQIAGAANLRVSQLSLLETKAIIRNGKNSMPKFSKLADKDVDAVVAYVQTLK